MRFFLFEDKVNLVGHSKQKQKLTFLNLNEFNFFKFSKKSVFWISKGENRSNPVN